MIKGMSATLRQVQELIARGEVKISAHGYDELANDRVLVSEDFLRRNTR
jgi:hypothetical protein